MSSNARVKLSRSYLERVWLPRLGAEPPVLDVGKADYTAHYAKLAGTSRYVTVDIDPGSSPDIVADATSPEFVAQARKRHAEYGSILFNGVLGFGVNTEAGARLCLRHFRELLRPGGLLFIGWNEWKIGRGALAAELHELGFERVPIEGQEVFTPEETEGYEHLHHRYMLWRSPGTPGRAQTGS
jgi:hypothetical protein